MADEPLDRRPITRLQAERLAKVADLNVDEITGLSVAELSTKYRWLDEFFRYRRICGRVVRRDPVSGALQGVPYATVHVEDTDCSVLSYLPSGWNWAWYFPFRCRREEVGTATTDACGRFCVYVPRWEIDWILRWRFERKCLDIFIKPSIGDILDGLRPMPEPWPPIPRDWPPEIRRPLPPDPDPGPVLREGGAVLRRAEELVGRTIARRLASSELDIAADVSNRRIELLEAPRFAPSLVPPLPPEFEDLDRAVEMIGRRLEIDPGELKGVDFRQPIGPFWPCHDVFFPEWSPIFDVPDVTFRVTQDVDGDGTEEAIYTEGLFDVRWDATTIPNVTLEASTIAVPGIACGTPELPCVDFAEINRAGLMPLKDPPSPANPYHDATTGYARRPNRPHPSGLEIEPGTRPMANTPFLDTLQLYGCNHQGGAQFYRLRYSLGAASPVEFSGLSWPVYRFAGGFQSMTISPDANGWYPILNDADGWEPNHLLLNWPTGQAGLYMIDMQLGDAAKNVIDTTNPPVGVRVDNSSPLAQLAVSYRQMGAATWMPLGPLCPVVERPAGAEIQFQVQATVSAPHLRSILLNGGGCGGQVPVLTSPVPAQWEALLTGALTTGVKHFYAGPMDTGVSLTAEYSLAAAAPQGAYSFSLAAYSRAFNPSGGDGGFGLDWNYDPAVRYSPPSFTFAVVDS